MNPFVAFCLYVAGRVFVQYLSTKRNDQQSASSFHFLLNAMHALKKKNPLNSSFLAQLEVDMDTAGVRNPYSDQIPQEAPKSAKMVSLLRRTSCEAYTDMPHNTREIRAVENVSPSTTFPMNHVPLLPSIWLDPQPRSGHSWAALHLISSTNKDQTMA